MLPLFLLGGRVAVHTLYQKQNVRARLKKAPGAFLILCGGGGWVRNVPGGGGGLRNPSMLRVEGFGHTCLFRV